MNNLLIAIAVFVITIVGSLFAVPYFIDWNSYRSLFEEEASRVVGREVQVDGDVNLYLLPSPYFRLEKVRVADTSKTLTEPFFRAESLTIKVSIAPMIRGVLEVTDIEFQRPVLHLALDAKDGWNWQGFVQALGSYIPTNVTLTSLKIADGTLALHGPDGAERTRLEGVNGELSAPALEGPYRFKGDFVSGGLAREFRLGTAAAEPDGSVRFRASLRLADTGATYLLDARVADLMGKPRVEGDLTARLPIAGLWEPAPRAAARKQSADGEHKLDRSDAGFEAKAAVKADAGGAELSDLQLTFEQDGRPQLVTGTVKANWRSALTLEMSLASKWLDLDRIAGAAEGAGPMEGIAKFAASARDLLPEQGRSRAAIAIDQAKLGGETIGTVRLGLTRSAGKLEIDELQARLPGGSRIDLKGSVSGRRNALAFNSNLGLRGTSLARFMNWATGNLVAVDSKSDGAFGLRARVTLDAGYLVVQDLFGNLSGTTLSGRATYRWGDRPELTANLESQQLDARAFVPAGTSVANVFDFLLQGPKSDGRSTPGSFAWRGNQADLKLRLKAGQLITAARTYRDVTASIDLKSGHLEQVLLRLAGDDGYALEVDGRIEDAASRPKGTLRGSASADTAAGIAPLAELFGVPLALRPDEARSQAMTPLRLAGSVAFGRTETSADFTVDGEANGAVVKFTGRFDGSSGGWRNGRTDATIVADAADSSKLVWLVLGGDASRAETEGPGRMQIRATGVPSEVLATFASLETRDVGLKYRGQVTAIQSGSKASGDLEVRAGDGMRLVALAGLAPPLKLDRTPINARLKLAVDGGNIDMEQLALQVGNSKMNGQIKLSPAVAGQRRRVDARLDLESITLAGLLSTVLDQQFAIADQAEAAIAGRAGMWPDAPFDPQMLDGFDGNMKLTSRRLVVADGVTLENAKIDIVLGAGRVDVKEIVGNGLGGQFRGRLRIDKNPVGADVQGALTFGVALEDFPAGSTARATGPVFGTVEFSGRGRSPRTIISALQGQGKIEFGDAKLAALWPGAVAAAVQAALKVEPDKLSSTVRQALAAGLGGGLLPVQRKAFTVEITDGQLKVKSPTMDTGEGRVTGTANLDLRALNFDSQWRLEGKLADADAAAKPLPMVSVVYRGPITSLGTLEPRIDSGALEQELSARKIERDMDELDRLRKMDEQRRLNEADRLRKQFEVSPPIPRPPPGVPIAPGQKATPG